MKSLLAGLSLSALLLTSCSGAVSSGENISIGFVGPLSGEVASLGVPIHQAAELAAAKVNEMWADRDITFTLIAEDGKCNGQDATAATQKLIDIDGVGTILGGLCSGESLSMVPIAEQAGVFMLSATASSPELTGISDYFYRNWPSDSDQGGKLADLALSLGHKKVGIVVEETDYARGIELVFTDDFLAGGGDEVISESFISDDNDFSTQLTRLKGEEIDVLFLIPQNDVKGQTLVKQAQEQGFEGPLLLNDVIGTHQPSLEAYADYLEGSHTTTFEIDTESDEMLQFQADYQAAYGTEAEYLAYSAAIYDAVMMLAEAALEVGTDGEAMKTYFESYDTYSGLTGVIGFDDNNDLKEGKPFSPLLMVSSQLKNNPDFKAWIFFRKF